MNYLPPASKLSPASDQRQWSGDYNIPSICACVRSSRFYMNLNISFIYTDMFNKSAGNVYGYENMFVQMSVASF